MNEDRAAFERHAKSLGYSVDPDTRPGREGGYWSSHTHLMWQTWQAALAEPVATMTVREDMGVDFKFSRPHTLQPGQQFYLCATPPQRPAESVQEPMSVTDLQQALAEADRIMGHDDEATEWRNRWAHLFQGAAEPPKVAAVAGQLNRGVGAHPAEAK